MNPNNELHLTRLHKAIQQSTKQLRPFREVRKSMIKAFVGSNYGQGDQVHRPETIMNLLYQTAETYTMTLAANRPRILVSSDHPENNWFAHTFQLSLNNLIKEIHLENILRKAVMDAFFTLGIVKVYTADAGLVQLEGEDAWVDPGKPFAENISLDDFVYDTTAPEWRKSTFALNKYRISKENAQTRDRRCGTNAWATGLVSDGAGVHPSQVKEFREDLSNHGFTGVSFKDNGDCVFTSRKERSRYLRHRGLHDRNGGYGD